VDVFTGRHYSTGNGTLFSGGIFFHSAEWKKMPPKAKLGVKAHAG
jgi:uncharacterized membrane protein